jgi:UDP-N-acetylmuramoylalanine--D-glutamate ligase
MKVPWPQGDWDRVLVYGLGESGKAAVKLLLDRGAYVVAVDRQEGSELGLEGLEGISGLELELGREPLELPVGIEGVVVSPGVPREQPLLQAARAAGIPVIAEVELGFAFLTGPVIGITGSNGKSTTAALTGALLQSAGYSVEVCGNIGVPLCACVEGAEGRVFVVELSSFQLEAVDTFHPRAAALLNVSPDHLDRHGAFSEYLASKTAIFARQTELDLAIINGDDPVVRDVATRARRKLFSRRSRVREGCYLEGESVVEVQSGRADQELFERRDLALHGLQNLENAMAAALLARSMGASAETFPATLASFAALPHRMQRVAMSGGVSWIDDSKGTNIGATLKSLEGFPDHSVHLILGGRSKGADFSPLVTAVAQKARRVYLIGEAAEQIEQALAGAVPLEKSTLLSRAVESAARRVQAGESVLLSPACASFDQYGSFVDRGVHFRELVRRALGLEVDGG